METPTTTNSTALEYFARIISAILHPMLVPAIAFTILIFADTTHDLAQKCLFETIAITFSVVVIVGYILFLKQKGLVTSSDIIIREQRIHPLLMGAISYFVGFLLLKALGASTITQGLMFCYATNTLLIVLITKWWKISVHTTAISGPLVALTFQFGGIILLYFILIPLVGISRLILKRHTLAQVLVGAAIGIGLTALQLQFWFSRI